MAVLDPELSGAWELPEHLTMLRDTIRRFMVEEVRPVEERQPHDSYALPTDELEALREKAKAAGLWCMASPEEVEGDTISKPSARARNSPPS